MIRVALRGLAGRKFRAVLTALAVVLGVAMVSGTFVLTDTLTKAFDEIFVTSRNQTSVVVSGRKIVAEAASGRATVPAGLSERIRRLPEVEAAAGTVESSARIVGSDGKIVATRGAPTFGLGLDFDEPRFFGWRLERGRWPASSQEVAIDRATADDEGLELGDRVGVVANGPIETFRLSGVVGFRDVGSLGGATAAIFDIPTAQRLFDKEGRLDTIAVAARPGIEPEQLVRRVAPLLPPSAEVRTGEEQAESDSEQVSQGLGLLRAFLLAFAAVSLFVGAFVIFNTFSITVAQRTRELATLRTLGASRRQVLGSIVVEAGAIGLAASLVGLAAGLALARGLTALFVASGLDLPSTDTVFALRTIVVSLLVGTGIALVAGLAPGLRATRVPPIAAVREGAVLPPSRLARVAPVLAGVLLALAAALVGYGMLADAATTQRLLTIGAGCVLLFVGVALLSSRLVRPLASLVGRPAQWAGGLAGRLARENATRSPGRTAATAAALMVGLALVTFVASLGHGLRTSIADSVNEQVQAEYVLTSQSTFDPFPAAAGAAVAGAEGVEASSSIRTEEARAAGQSVTVTAVEPTTITSVFRFDWAQGSEAVLHRLTPRGAILIDSFAEDEGLRVGSPLEILTPTGDTLAVRVVGLAQAPPLGGGILGEVTIATTTFDRVFASPQNANTYVNVRGEPAADAQRDLERALTGFPDAKVQTRAEFVESQQASIGLLLNMLYVLLALSIVVSLFGMVNTMALSIVERTRELGMLRAIGMSRRQTRRMVRHESVITALIGAALGLPVGIFLALAVSLALSGEGIRFAVPVGSLVVFALAAIAAGILAAIVPARRAARLNVLGALQYE